MWAFTPKARIRRDDTGLWQIDTGVYGAEPIPHPTWENAWSHALFMFKIDHEDA